MAASLVFRPMVPGDLSVVLGIEAQSFPRPWSRPLFEKELTTAWARLSVAEETHASGPVIVGYSCVWRVVDEVHLLNLAVHPGRRGRGLGRRMVEHLIAEATDAGARVVLLEVRAGNREARRLYGRLGFRAVRIRRGYYGPGQDAIVMERAVGAP